ncbi:RES family NAD+ phosphorylase [Desulfospira joergensenii]|uniref:RES family NAD+ phosphorylase n=1 Tax=Desulfospira joergensenii TaxID=53329 RepID=UPI0003B390E5|nr:RES family NAD+ phosphorylase [Desulfospira joergensenii]
MEIVSWRIVKERYVSAAFNGIGAKKAGGRWNSPGTSMVYTAQSLSLATLELTVHLPSVDLLKGYKCVSITFNDSCITASPTLPVGWDMHPPGPASQLYGDQWILNGKSAVLEVPSVVIPGESNYLINPIHSDFADMNIGSPVDYPYDPRLHKTI